jgi:hypothetical protein
MKTSKVYPALPKGPKDQLTSNDGVVGEKRREREESPEPERTFRRDRL